MHSGGLVFFPREFDGLDQTGGEQEDWNASGAKRKDRKKTVAQFDRVPKAGETMEILRWKSKTSKFMYEHRGDAR